MQLQKNVNKLLFIIVTLNEGLSENQEAERPNIQDKYGDGRVMKMMTNMSLIDNHH